MGSVIRVCHITGRRKKVKSLEASCKYVYCESTKDLAFIQDPAFILVILLFPPATKRKPGLYTRPAVI